MPQRRTSDYRSSGDYYIARPIAPLNTDQMTIQQLTPPVARASDPVTASLGRFPRIPQDVVVVAAQPGKYL